MGLGEAFRLHEHAAGAAGGVVDAAFVGGEHLDEAAHDAGRGVELAAVLGLGLAACDSPAEEAAEEQAEAIEDQADMMEDAGEITDAEADVMEEQADRIEDAAEGDTDMGTNDDPIGETVDESTM